ncbi:choice-of-anchor E domain-containing protein [Duganella qianjiadongensis]|uniref:choice-of-anchor E domain-containing protein n=1 Tax=Duganella qianjiadongensis TaxID=2692176 RepID=UPI001E5F4E51|nr:choice-of-anchor E domain-containing protein [Duganella qianjiadongensis]
MTKFTKTLIAVATLLLAAGAQAATVQQTLPQSATIFDVENFPGTLSFAQFDSHLGTLTSVTFELFSTLNGSIKLTNKDPGTEWFSVKTGADMTASVGGKSLVTGNWVTPGYLLASGATVNDTLQTQTVSQALNFTQTADLAQFIGHGSYSASLSAISDQELTAGGNARYGTDVTVDGYAKVTYTYTTLPVPEPETYAMLLAGLGLVGVVARRRKSA